MRGRARGDGQREEVSGAVVESTVDETMDQVASAVDDAVTNIGPQRGASATAGDRHGVSLVAAASLSLAVPADGDHAPHEEGRQVLRGRVHEVSPSWQGKDKSIDHARE